MSNPKPNDIRIKVRQNWYQFWLPEYIVIPGNHELFTDLQHTAVYLRQAAVDVINYSNKMNRNPSIEEKPNVVQSVNAPIAQQRHIPVKDAAELDGVTGGDAYIEPLSEFSVEYNPQLNPTWTPNQTNGNVAVAEPAYVRAMKGRLTNDLRKLQDQ